MQIRSKILKKKLICTQMGDLEVGSTEICVVPAMDSLEVE